MFRKLRSRITYANVMSTIAVFLALGGVSAYAANEWNGSNIQDETLTGADVKGKPGTLSGPAVNGTLTGLDISGQAANAGNHTPFVQGSLTGADVKDGSLTGHDVGTYSAAVFVGNVGTVAASSCSYGSISLPFTPKETDHIVLTPQYSSTETNLNYTAEVRDEAAFVKVCNPTSGPLIGNATFNMLVIPQ